MSMCRIDPFTKCHSHSIGYVGPAFGCGWLWLLGRVRWHAMGFAICPFWVAPGRLPTPWGVAAAVAGSGCGCPWP